jgi:hypothetical protein
MSNPNVAENPVQSEPLLLGRALDKRSYSDRCKKLRYTPPSRAFEDCVTAWHS